MPEIYHSTISATGKQSTLRLLPRQQQQRPHL